jgi:hypothetical protein
VAFKRETVVYQGGNPVWYLNTYPGNGFSWLAHDVNKLIDSAALGTEGRPSAENFVNSPIGRLTPFIEAIGEWRTETQTTKRKDFAFEREWRFHGHFRFFSSDVAFVVVPPGAADTIRAELLAQNVDEQRIARYEFRELSNSDAMS